MTLSRRPTYAGLPTNIAPEHDQFVPTVRLGQPNRYGYQVDVIVRDIDSGISTSRRFTYFSRERVAPNEAIADAMNTYQDGLEENPDYESERIEGAVLTGLYYTVAPTRR